MIFLVCSKVSIPAKDRTLPCWEYLRSLGHEVIVEHPNDVSTETTPDVVISMGVTVMLPTFEALKRFPGVPLYAYNWDVYAWVWDNPRPGEYDYRRYGDLLRLAKEVWVPSACTGRRTEQWYDGVNNWHVVLSACPWWDYPDTSDKGYALCCLREIPDPFWGKFEQACQEVGIPYRMTKHEQTYEQYQDIVAHCRFLCAPLFELSTGGLSLMEGYYLGKPCLISDSEWNGGRDYMGDRAAYFKHDDWNDFKEKLYTMYHSTPYVPSDHRDWITTNFSDKRMVDDMLVRIQA